MAIAKVVLNDNTFLDLTQDTVDTEKLQEDIVAYGADGLSVTGTMNLDSTVENQIVSKTLVNYTNSNISSLASFAFLGQASLENVNIGKISSIPEYSFYGNTSLTSIFDTSEITSIGNYSFYNCSSLSSISFPSVTTLGTYAFQNCVSLGALDSNNFPSVTTIGTYDFNGCTGLETVDLSNVTSVASYAFNGCTGLTSVNLPNATSVASYTFLNCSNLSSAILPNITTIQTSTFSACYKLANIETSKLTSIGGNGLYRCDALPGYSYPKLTSVGGSAFYGCRGGGIWTFPKVSSLGTNAFRQVAATTMDLGPKLSNLPDYTFYQPNYGGYITNLILRRFQSIVTAAHTRALEKINRAASYVYVPQDLIASYKAATNWSSQKCTFVALEGSQYEHYLADGNPVPHLVVRTLTNVTSSNTGDWSTYLEAYSTTLTANEGYEMTSVTVIMDNVDVTSSVYDSSTGEINIDSTLGNIVITAVAEAPAVEE